MKYFVVAFSLFFLSSLVSAQNCSRSFLPDTKFYVVNLAIAHQHKQLGHVSNKRPLLKEVLEVSFGLRAGMNLSNMNFNKGHPSPATPVEPYWKAGFIAGLLLEVPLFNKFSIQQGYLYSQVGGKYKEIETSYKHCYLSLPLVLKYKVLGKLALVAGPQFDLLIQARESISGKYIDTTHETEERSIGAIAGIELKLSKHLSLNARFMHGLNHIGMMQRPGRKEFKYEVVQLSTDFRL